MADMPTDTSPSWPAVHERAAARGVNVFGAGRFARDLAAALRAEGVAVHAFFTSGAAAQPLLDGLPWRTLQAEDLAARPLWIGAFNYQRASDYAALRIWLRERAAGAEIVWPQRAFDGLHARLGFRFWLEPTASYAASEDARQAARALLDDEASRATFDAIVAFRSDPGHFADPPQPRDDVHYLPHWLQQHLRTLGVSALRMVDAGAYQGETIRELDGHMPVAQAWAFEPDAASFAAMAAQMADWPRPLVLMPAGLSARSEQLRFTSGEGESSHVGADGTHHIHVLALDDALHHAGVNFVKIDVEGHELQALAGMRATLARDRPTLAVAGYHRWDDLWRIPAFIASLGLGYRIRIGLHQHNSFETVIYGY